MNCEGALELFLQSLTGDLDVDTRATMEAHLATCSQCRESSDGLLSLWDELEALPQETPSEALRPRFYAMLHDWRTEKQSRPRLRERLNGWLASWWPRQPVFQLGLALALLAAGFVLGPRLRRNELAQLRNEIQSTRRLATISMLQQQSPSQRLQGVSFSYELQEPDPDVIQALLLTLDADANVNVRLAAVDALGQFTDLPEVRRGLLDSFQSQTSPLVQIALIDVLVQAHAPDLAAMLQRVAQDPKLHESVRQRAQWGLQRPL